MMVQMRTCFDLLNKSYDPSMCVPERTAINEQNSTSLQIRNVRTVVSGLPGTADHVLLESGWARGGLEVAISAQNRTPFADVIR